MATKAKLEANDRYLKKQDNFPMHFPKGKKEVYKAQAERRGMSLNAYIIDLIEKDMER